MTKEIYDYYSEKDQKYLKKARLFYGLFASIFALLVVLMFIYQIYSYFVNIVIIVVIMYFLYKLFFKEFIYYIRNKNDIKRVKLMKMFTINDSVLEFFSGEVFRQLFDYDFTILNKNNVYILARTKIKDSINSLGLAVYLLDEANEEISPTVREISNEMSGYIGNSSCVKVILLIRDKFTNKELDLLKYDSAVHNNTVVIGLEKSTKQLIYNYFLNGEAIDTVLSDLFEVDLTRQENND